MFFLCVIWFKSNFRNLLLKNIGFFPTFSKWALIRGPGIPKIADKMDIWGIQIGGWAFITVWAFNRLLR